MEEKKIFIKGDVMDTYMWAACDCEDRTSGGGTAWFWEDLDDIDMVGFM